MIRWVWLLHLLHLRRLWLGGTKKLEWDDPLPEFLRQEWISFFVELFEMETIKFRRSIKPNDALGDSVMAPVPMSDGNCRMADLEVP